MSSRRASSTRIRRTIPRGILDGGPLARRMLAVTGSAPDRASLRRLAENLCRCLEDDVPLGAAIA